MLDLLMTDKITNFEGVRVKGGIDVWRTNQLQISMESPLKVGGMDGPKFVMKLEKSGRKSEMFFVSKEYKTKKEAKEAVTKFEILRKGGYPVPPTTRYFEKGGKHYILVTDLTKLNGGQTIWGINGDPMDHEYATIQKMNPDQQNLSDKILSLADKFDREGIYAFKDVYAIGMSKDSQGKYSDEINVYILDVNGLYVEGKNYSDRSRDQAIGFLRICQSDIDKAKRMATSQTVV